MHFATTQNMYGIWLVFRRTCMHSRSKKEYAFQSPIFRFQKINKINTNFNAEIEAHAYKYTPICFINFFLQQNQRK